MTTTQAHPELKRIGGTGQVSVGKALAGKLVRVEQAPDGIMLRFVVDIPEKDAWWAHEPYKSQLKGALAWADKNPAAETDLEALLARVKPAAATSLVPAKKKAKTSTSAAKKKRK